MARLWDIAVNWDQPYEVTLEYRTEISRSRNGKEQRRALRTLARRKVAFSSSVSRDRYRVAARHLADAQGAVWDIPDLSECAFLAAPAFKLDRGVPIELGPHGGAFETESDCLLVATEDGLGFIQQQDTTPYWATAGKTVILSDGDRHEAVVIGVDGAIVTEDGLSYFSMDDEAHYVRLEEDGPDQIVFEAPLSQEWPAGAQMSPPMSGRLAASLNGTALTDSVVRLSVEFEIDPGSEDNSPPLHACDVFDGREVFTKTPNWGEPINLGFVSGRERVDYGQGRVADFLPIEFPETSMRAVYIGRDRYDIDVLKAFFKRMRGQRGEFYMSTGMSDIVPIQALASGQSTLVVAGTDFALAYGSDTVHKAIAVELRSGETLRRKVSSIAIAGSNSQITLAEAWPENIALSDIRMVSWLLVWRFASDSMTVEYLTHGVGRMSIPMMTLENLSAE